MKIKDRLSENRVNISFEVFPPKTDAGYGKVLEATEEIAALKPSFMEPAAGQARIQSRLHLISRMILGWQVLRI